MSSLGVVTMPISPFSGNSCWTMRLTIKAISMIDMF